MRFVQIALAVSVCAQAADLNWTAGQDQGGNVSKAWYSVVYDSQFNVDLEYSGTLDGQGIYSNNIWARQSNGTWVNLWTSGFSGTICGTGDTTHPQNRHPYRQMAYNTTRHYMLIYSGACAGTGGPPANFAWKFTHNNTASSGAMAQIAVTGGPGAPANVAGGSMVYDPTHDVTFFTGGNVGTGSTSTQTWVFCDVATTSVGCTNANDWNLVTTTGSPHAVDGGAPVWDAADGLVLYYGGSDAVAAYTTIDSYNPTAKTWTTLSPTGTPPSTPMSFSVATWDSTRNRLIVITSAGTYAYSKASNAWSTLTSSGTFTAALNSNCNGNQTTGGIWCSSIVYNPTNDVIIGEYVATGPANAYATATLGAISIPITVEEALYPGDPTGTVSNTTSPSYLTRGGVARANAPFCLGVPIPDASSLTGLGSLSLSGVTNQQFRTLGTWISGNIQWVEACGTLASFGAGSLASVTLTNNGSGTGANMATDNGTTITVATGACTFTVKKASFNGLDTVDCGSTPTHMVLTGGSGGFVILGPASPGTSCGTCATTYASFNDSSSTVTIEKNGPVEVVLKATFQYKDGSGNAYLRATARMYFHAQQSDVKIRHVLQNSDFGANGSFATAYKGMAAHEFRVAANPAALSGTLNFTVGNHTATPTTGTMSGSDAVTIYQGQSQLLNWGDCPSINQVPNGTVNVNAAGTAVTWVSGSQFGSVSTNVNIAVNGVIETPSSITATTMTISPALPGGPLTGVNWTTGWCGAVRTVDQGYAIQKNAVNLQTGTVTQYPQGWADASTAGGVGIQIGMADFPAHWPASLEFRAGGPDVRVGLHASENSHPYYSSWPQWELNEFWISFHASAPQSLPNAFLTYQHRLLAHASIAAYNLAGVFPYHLSDPAAEDTYVVNQASVAVPATGSSGCCIQDNGVNNTSWQRYVYLGYSWHADGGANQSEFRWGNLLNFIRRDMPGRYLDSEAFYEFHSQIGWPHSDGFAWQSHPSNLDGWGQPAITSSNFNNANCPISANGSFICAFGNMWGAGPNGQEHWHAYGQGDYYLISGDDFIKDSLVPLTDFFTNPSGFPSTIIGGDTGTVNVAGTAVTLATGTNFGAWMAGQYININGSAELVTVFTDTTHITVKPTMGTLTGVSYGSNGGVFNTRSVGVYLLWFTRYARYLSSIGDSNSSAVLAAGLRMYDVQVKSPLCLSGYPSGCTFGTPASTVGWHTQGVNPARGAHLGSTGAGTETGSFPRCGYGNDSKSYRVEGVFQQAILAQGIFEFRQQQGSSWSDYWPALDLAYGLSQFGIGEQFVQTIQTGNPLTTWFNQPWVVNISGTAVTRVSGPNFTAALVGTKMVVNGNTTVVSVTDTSHLTIQDNQGTVTNGQMGNFNGFRFGVFLDEGNAAAFPTPNASDCDNYPATLPVETGWGLFLGQFAEIGNVNNNKWLIEFGRMLAGYAALSASDIGQYQWSYIIDNILNNSGNTLQTQPITSFADNGGGSYTIGWNTPANTKLLRVKWGTLRIVDLIGYDSGLEQFIGNPVTTQNWFSSNDVTPSAPAPITGPQVMTFTALDPLTGNPVTGLTALGGNFVVKAMSPTIATNPPSTLMHGVICHGCTTF